MRYHSFDRVRICETTGMQDGYLRIDVVNSENNFPIEGAEVSVSYGDSGQTQEVLRTNLSGQTEEIAVAAPPVSLSLEEQNREKPYADYTVEVRAAGYEPVKVKGTEVLAGVTAVQPIRMIPLPDQTGAEENIQIPDHTLYGSYPPKIAEDEVKPVQESGEIVLSRVVVPQTIVVHDGVPTNASAKITMWHTGIISKRGVERDLRDLAAQHDRRQCACDHVIYTEPGVYGVVSEPGLRFYNHFLDGIRSQVDLRA